jgi:hypothetical protein
MDVEDDVDASVPSTTAALPVFDPVAAEHDVVAAGDDVVFRFDADALDNADDVLSLHAMETLSLDDDAGLPVAGDRRSRCIRAGGRKPGCWKRTRFRRMCRWKRRWPRC